LSYTQFAYADLQIKERANAIGVSFRVKNVGKRDGGKVAQVYVKLPDQAIPMPVKQLKCFKRITVKKGESELIELEIEKAQLRFWNEAKSIFITPNGNYTIMVGASSDDIRLTRDIGL